MNCASCDTDGELAEQVSCQGCGQNFCRRRCWRFHSCSEITDRNGAIIREGCRVRYPTHPDREYLVLETPETFKRVGVLYGKGRRPDEKQKIFYARLVEVF